MSLQFIHSDVDLFAIEYPDAAYLSINRFDDDTCAGIMLTHDEAIELELWLHNWTMNR